MQSLVLLVYLHKCSGSPEEEWRVPHTAWRDDEVFIHLACSESFDVQLQDCRPSELVDDVP